MPVQLTALPRLDMLTQLLLAYRDGLPASFRKVCFCRCVVLTVVFILCRSGVPDSIQLLSGGSNGGALWQIRAQLKQHSVKSVPIWLFEGTSAPRLGRLKYSSAVKSDGGRCRTCHSDAHAGGIRNANHVVLRADC